MTRENILLEITTKNNGMLADMAIVMIEESFIKNASNIVAWRREGQKILVRSTREEIMDAISTKKLNGYQKKVLIYTEIKNDI